MRELHLQPVTGLPEIAEGARLGALVAEHASPGATDIVVIAQKIVSKAEGRIVELSFVEPSRRARELAEQVGKDPRLVELILSESRSVLRAVPGVLIVETLAGWTCANAGIDSSNVPGDAVALLPADADASARRIRSEVEAACGVRPAVVITDSFGRPWRVGQTDVAIGCAGLAALDDWRGRTDREGRVLAAAAPALIDQIAGAADLCRDKDDGAAVVLVGGLGEHISADDGPGAAAIQRPVDEDLFR